MKRLFAIGLSLLMLVGFSADAVAMWCVDKKAYAAHVERAPYDLAIAMAPNGCWAVGSGIRIYNAKSAARRACYAKCKTTCEIKDVNAKSAFIKQRGTCGSTSTASSSSSTASSALKAGWCSEPKKTGGRLYQRIATKCKGKIFETYDEAAAEYNRAHGIVYPEIGPYDTIWCANKLTVAEYKKWNCDEIGGTAHRSKSLAQAEHNRLNATSSAASSSSSTAFDPAAKPKWVIRVGIFQILSNARARENLLRKSGYPTGNELVRFDGHEAIRVFVGPFDTKDEAINLESSVAAVTQDKTFVADYYSNAVSSSSSIASSSSSTSSTTTQTAQTTTAQPSTVDKSALELAFWTTIQKSKNPDMFRAYLKKYPDGEFAFIAEVKIKELSNNTSSVAKTSIPRLNYGDYYALVIGNNKYDHLRELRTAVNDARAVSSLLEDGYGFKVKRLENATRSDILNSITELRGKVGRKDNVLIYYAGHGVEDKAADEGFWIPIDAKLEEQDNWLSTDRVRKQIKAMPAKHVMVVADSCFSGTILRSSDITRGLKIERTSPEYEHYLKRIVEDKSRTALTSGGLEPVMDSGGGEHSVFANYFLSILRDNESVLDAQRLFSELRPKVMANSNQKPEYGTIHLAGDDGGDFLFVRQ